MQHSGNRPAAWARWRCLDRPYNIVFLLRSSNDHYRNIEIFMQKGITSDIVTRILSVLLYMSNPEKGNLATKKSLRLHFFWRAGSALFAAGSIAHGHFKLHDIDDFFCFAFGTEQRVIKKSCIVVHLQPGFAATDGIANPAGFFIFFFHNGFLISIQVSGQLQYHRLH